MAGNGLPYNPRGIPDPAFSTEKPFSGGVQNQGLTECFGCRTMFGYCVYYRRF